MRRIEVSKRLGSVEEVRGSLAAHRNLIRDNLDVQRPPAPDTGFSYEVMFDHFDGELAKVESRLVEAEDRHTKQLARIRQLRRRRDEGVTDTYNKQTATRGIISNLYGKDYDFELAAVSGKTPVSSRILAEQVDQTVKFLRSPVGEPSEKVAGVGLDFETLADDLERGQRRLIQVRAELVEATKFADGTRQNTNRAIKDFDLVFLWIARSLEGLFRLAGEEDLAERIRTSVRRVTRRQAEQDTEQAESEESSSDDSSEEGAESATSESAESATSESAESATSEAESAPSEVAEEASSPAAS